MAGWLRLRIGFDRVAAVGLLGVLAPLVALTAVAVRRYDGGPPFIRLRRVGRRGAGFHVWKLRTMSPAPEDPQAAGSPLSAADDQRITGVGAALRRFCLDEWPQLLNVIKGEMALIGPRPEDPAFVDLDDERWCAALCLPPGIAGLTQVLVHDWEAMMLTADTREATYRDRVLPVKLAVDQWYVANATPLVDLLVVLALIERFAAGRRHTMVHRRVLPRLPSEASTILSTSFRHPPAPGSQDG
jgi:lipopolysaccharide/colanic/teichoic acid biosynthesis glycosyltransferase